MFICQGRRYYEDVIMCRNYAEVRLGRFALSEFLGSNGAREAISAPTAGVPNGFMMNVSGVLVVN